MVNTINTVITKVGPTSVILRLTVQITRTELTYNADLGNGADGWQATASTAPIFWSDHADFRFHFNLKGRMCIVFTGRRARKNVRT